MDSVGRKFDRSGFVLGRQSWPNTVPTALSSSVTLQRSFSAERPLYGLARCHEISRNLIRVWIAKYEAGEMDEGPEAADVLQQYEARIAALERLVRGQALEIEFLKGA